MNSMLFPGDYRQSFTNKGVPQDPEIDASRKCTEKIPGLVTSGGELLFWGQVSRKLKIEIC